LGSLVMELTRNSYFNGQTLRLDGAIRMPPKWGIGMRGRSFGRLDLLTP
jgi:hypothetical protein